MKWLIKNLRKNISDKVMNVRLSIKIMGLLNSIAKIIYKYAVMTDN